MGVLRGQSVWWHHCKWHTAFLFFCINFSGQDNLCLSVINNKKQHFENILRFSRWQTWTPVYFRSEQPQLHTRRWKKKGFARLHYRITQLCELSSRKELYRRCEMLSMRKSVLLAPSHKVGIRYTRSWCFFKKNALSCGGPFFLWPWPLMGQDESVQIGPHKEARCVGFSENKTLTAADVFCTCTLITPSCPCPRCPRLRNAPVPSPFQSESCGVIAY